MPTFKHAFESGRFRRELALRELSINKHATYIAKHGADATILSTPVRTLSARCPRPVRTLVRDRVLHVNDCDHMGYAIFLEENS
jgi:hypothetical protein